MDDRFQNRLTYEWSSDGTALKSITDDVSTIKFLRNASGYYSAVQLWREGDPNTIGTGMVEEVTIGIDDGLKVKKTGYGVNENGVYSPSTVKEQVITYGYAGGLSRICYSDSIYEPTIEVWYDNYGRTDVRRDYVDASTYLDTYFDYEFYYPDPRDKEVSNFRTVATSVDGYGPLRDDTTIQDQFGQVIEQYTRPWDGSAGVDSNSVYESHWMEVGEDWVLRPVHLGRPKESYEYFDGMVRKTANTYNSYHDLAEQRIYVDASNYVATELTYHPDMPFVTSQTSYQGYNKTGATVQKLNLYGNADGTENTHGCFLVKEKVFLDDGQTGDPNDDEWAVTAYTYYANGLVKTKTDPNGFVSLYAYDELGAPVQVWLDTVDANDVPYQRFWNDTKGRQVLAATSLGAVTFNCYDDFDRVYRVMKYEDADALTIDYSSFVPLRYYDPNSIDPNYSEWGPMEPVDVVEFGYDMRGNRTFEKMSTGGTVRTEYTRHNQPRTVTYDDGSFIEYYYDERGNRVIEYKYEAGSDSAWDLWTQYDALDRPVWVGWYEDAESWDTIKEQASWYYASGKKCWDVLFGMQGYETASLYEYDVLDRMIKSVVDPNAGGEFLQLATEYGYDAAGNRTSVIDPAGSVIYSRYDNAGRRVAECFAAAAESDPNDAVVSKLTDYWPTGKVRTVRSYDYDGTTLLAQSDYRYDSRGRVTEVVEQIADANEATTVYYYNDAGFTYQSNPYHIRITDAEGKQTHIALDAFGRRVETLYSSGDYEHKVYNGDGTLAAAAVWDAGDQKQWIEYDYDAYGRVDRVTYPDEGYVTYAYDGFGRKTQVSDYRNATDNIGGTGTIAYEYDALGRVSKITDQDGWIVEYDYTSDGQKSQVRVRHPADGTVKYHVANLYDKALRLQYVSEPLNGVTTGWIARVAYDDNGNRAGLTYYRDGTLDGDTTVIEYTYNLDNRLTAYSTTGGPTFTLAKTTVDGLGRLVEADETLTKPDSSTITHSLDYTYDIRSQLLSASMTNINGGTWQAAYAYDKAGNVTSEVINSTPTAFTYDGDLMTAKGSDDLTWDSNGRMIAGVTSSLTYNHDGKLQSGSMGGVTVDLKYDPDGNRIYREVDDGVTTTKRKYVIDTEGDLPVVLLEINPEVSDPNGCIVKTYLYAGTDTIAQHDGCYADDKYFYLSDRIGSVRQVIDVNASVEHLYSYGPFGKRLEADSDPDPVSNRLGFTGQYFDEELDQYHLRARQYDLATYRFTARDPYTGSFDKPLELHRYLYCLSNPINGIDPLGEFTLIELPISTGIQTAMRAYGAYGTYKRVRGYVDQFTAGASMRNIAMTVMVDVACDLAAGQALKFLSKAAAPALNRIGAKVSNLKSSSPKPKAKAPRHHFATNKSKKYSPKMKEIAEHYGLDLDGDWNGKPLPGHAGRHASKYHQWTTQKMLEAMEEAGDDVGTFTRLFTEKVIDPVMKNPDMLRKKWWE